MAKRIVYSYQFQLAFDDLLLACEDGIYNLDTIKKFRKALKSHLSLLRNNPGMGAHEILLEDKFRMEFRRFLIPPYFKIIYVEFSDHIYLVDIWDTRRAPEVLAGRVK